MWDGRVGAAIVEEQERDHARNLHRSQPSAVANKTSSACQRRVELVGRPSCGPGEEGAASTSPASVQNFSRKGNFFWYLELTNFQR